MATTPEDTTAAAPVVGDVRRYPVTQPDNSVRCQLVLITAAADANGYVRGVSLGYEDTAAQFQPSQFA